MLSAVQSVESESQRSGRSFQQYQVDCFGEPRRRRFGQKGNKRTSRRKWGRKGKGVETCLAKRSILSSSAPRSTLRSLSGEPEAAVTPHAFLSSSDHTRKGGLTCAAFSAGRSENDNWTGLLALPFVGVDNAVSAEDKVLLISHVGTEHWPSRVCSADGEGSDTRLSAWLMLTLGPTTASSALPFGPFKPLLSAPGSAARPAQPAGPATPEENVWSGFATASCTSSGRVAEGTCSACGSAIGVAKS